MQKLRIAGVALAAIFSIVLAVGMVVGTHEKLGVLNAIFYAIIGVVFIWLLYFLWGRLLEHAYLLGQKDAQASPEEEK